MRIVSMYLLKMEYCLSEPQFLKLMLLRLVFRTFILIFCSTIICIN